MPNRESCLALIDLRSHVSEAFQRETTLAPCCFNCFKRVCDESFVNAAIYGQTIQRLEALGTALHNMFLESEKESSSIDLELMAVCSHAEDGVSCLRSDSYANVVQVKHKLWRKSEAMLSVIEMEETL